MEKNVDIELRDYNIYPDQNVLKKVLGKSYERYCDLLNVFKDNNMNYEWRYYRDGRAWLCKVQKNRKTIVWMSAWKGYVKATIYFHKKYMKNVYKLGISEKQKENIFNSNKVGKSNACIFKIKSKEILKDIEKIIKYKILCK